MKQFEKAVDILIEEKNRLIGLKSIKDPKDCSYINDTIDSINFTMATLNSITEEKFEKVIWGRKNG
jgi:hypothetical protein